MNYERMWNSLKKIVNEETDILKKDSASFLLDELEAQYEEADYVSREMEAIETRELLLQEKENSEVENRC